MYAESRIAEKLLSATRYLGWTPEYHSVDEVDKFNAHLKSLEVVKSNGDIVLSRDLYDKEKRWIRNERAICFSDERYFSTRYAWVSNEENKLVHYSPRASQNIFHRILQHFDENNLSIEIQALKARQQGISTEVELKFTHRALFVPGAKCVAASADGQKSELMASMFYTVIDNIPWWLRPAYKKNRRSGDRGMIEFHTSSIVAIQSGTQQTGIGQGWTPTCAHISEVCDYSNPVALIDEGLMKAMHTSPVLFLILESTGNGNTGWWADKWRANKEFYPQGRARLFPMFLPWHLCTDMFPKSSWLEKYPPPPNWTPCKDTRAHAEKCKAFVRNTDYLKRELGAKWELPRHQQWFWEFNFQEAQRTHAEKSWLRQMPADDIEALSGKNDPVFGQETIEIISANRDRNYRVYGIVGEGIDEKHEPEIADVDYEAPRIEIEWNSPRGKTFQWMLVPLKPINESDENSAMGKLLVFEDPIRGCDYAAGVDAAGGVGGENSVISVARKGTDDEQDIQVCEIASNLIASAEMAPFCAAIGAWYGRDIPSYGQIKFAIEQTRKYGDDCQLQLKRMGFFRHHEMIRYDSKTIDPTSHRLGWFTQGWSRPMLLGRFQNAVENGWYKPNSPYLINEIQSFEQRHTATGMAKWEHQQGKKDDRIFGAGMSYFTSHHLDIMIERAQKRYNLPKNKLPAIDYSPYNANGFRVSDSGERW